MDPPTRSRKYVGRRADLGVNLSHEEHCPARKEILSLPPEERAYLALAAWESLEADPAFAADRTLDPEGIALALERDAEIESGSCGPTADDHR